MEESCHKFCSTLRKVNARIREDGFMNENLNAAFSAIIDTGDVWGDYDQLATETTRIANEAASRRGGGGGGRNGQQGKVRDGDVTKRTPEQAAAERVINDNAGKVCDGFNRGKCSRGNLCYYSHRCSRCGGNHPVTKCDQPGGNKRKYEQYQQQQYNHVAAPVGGPALPFAPMPPPGPPPAAQQR